MVMFIVKRLGVTALVLLVTSILSFSLVHLAGDPAVAMAGERATPEEIESIRRVYGFDRPFHLQYLQWMGDVLTGDLGRSNYLKKDVALVLAEHLPVTAMLGVLALAFALVLSVPLGVIAALKPNSLIDRAALVISVTGQSMPSFLTAIALVFIFGVMLPWLPISGNATIAHYVLPAVALGYYASPAIMRLTRSGMIDVLQSDHVKTARAYGLSAWQTIVRHGLRHAIIPVIAVATVQLGYMLGGSVVIEAVFSMDGIGNLAWLSIRRYDVEVIQAILLVVAAIYAGLALLGDLLNAVLDPRIRV